MRRIIYPLIAGIALLGIAASPALGRRDDHRAHERHHEAARHRERVHHRARVRHRTFGSVAASPSGSTNDGSRDAGTVSSFTGGVLTIALRDGSMVSGTVTRGTEVECRADGADANQDPGDNKSGDNTGERAHDEHSGSGSDNNRGDDDSNDRADNQDEMQNNCSQSTLQPGTNVREARLTLRPGGARWDKVELLTAATNGDQDS